MIVMMSTISKGKWKNIMNEHKNNMDFNALKFVVLRHRKDDLIKEDTQYFSDYMAKVIDSVSDHKDLEVLISASRDFSSHIDKLTSKFVWIC